MVASFQRGIFLRDLAFSRSILVHSGKLRRLPLCYADDMKGALCMDTIVLRVSELKKLAAELVKDGMQYVQVALMEGDVGEGLPPSAAFSAMRADRPFELVDYDELDGVPETEASFDLM
jgi:hypothetical protein